MSSILIVIGFLAVLMILLMLEQEALNPSKPDKKEAVPDVTPVTPVVPVVKEVTRVLTPLDLRIIQQTLIREKNKLSRISDDLYYDSRELKLGEIRLDANEARVAAEDRILDVRSVSQDLRDFDFGLTIRDEELNDKERKLDLKVKEESIKLIAKEEALKLEAQSVSNRKEELKVLKQEIKVYARQCLNVLERELNNIVYLSNKLKVERASVENERYANKLHAWDERLNTYQDYISKSYKLMNKELQLEKREGIVDIERRKLGLQNLFDRTNNSIERLKIQDSKAGGFFNLFQSRSSALEELIETHQIWTSYR